jgi:putative transposase
MLRLTPLQEGETYHVFNRGAHKQLLFTSAADHDRFQLSLYLANHTEAIVVRDIIGSRKYKEQFFGYPVDKSLVDVLAYSIMPNHFHLVLKQKKTNGITKFMKKICGGYSMYFNIKYGHSGTLFQGPFKSNHVNTDAYFNWIFAYVHLNPVSLVESKWEEQKLINVARSQRFLDGYKYSSYADYYTGDRPERNILAYSDGKDYMEKREDIRLLLSEYGRGRALYSAPIS